MTDPEQLFETMVESEVLAVDTDDVVTTTEEFEKVADLYHDIYTDLSEAEYHRSVAEAFGLESPEAAQEAIEDLGVDREQFVAYLSLNSYLEGEFSPDELAQMAAVVVEVGPASPVPQAVEEIDDESYEAFLGEHSEAIITVWRRGCAPCEAMKEDLPEILKAVPEGVHVAGIDPVAPSAFRREFRVDVAPAVVLFRDGEEVERFTGRTDPETLADAFDDAYR